MKKFFLMMQVADSPSGYRGHCVLDPMSEVSIVGKAHTSGAESESTLDSVPGVTMLEVSGEQTQISVTTSCFIW